MVRIILHYPQEVGRSIDEILRAVKGRLPIKISGNPENWPNNEWLGNKVIIPPANMWKISKKRLDEAKKDENIECLDWWFCTRKID